MDPTITFRQTSLAEAPVVEAANQLTNEVLPSFPLRWEPGNLVFVAIIEPATVLGVAEVRIDEDKDTVEAYIRAMAIAETYQKSGIGSALLEYTLESLENGGVEKAVLVASNSDNERFYRRHGFTGFINLRKVLGANSPEQV